MYHQICNKSKAMGVAIGAVTAYPSSAPEFIFGF